MKNDEIRLIWSKVCNESDKVNNFTKEEYLERNEPSNTDDKIKLDYHYKVFYDIKHDEDFRRKFEYCLKLFL